MVAVVGEGIGLRIFGKEYVLGSAKGRARGCSHVMDCECGVLSFLDSLRMLRSMLMFSV